MARQQRRTGRLTGIWRRRLRGSALVAGCYALPIIWPQVYGRSWHWFGSVWFNYGELLSLLPGAAIVVLVAPMVGYRRRKACAIFFPPAGIRVAWVVGIRLAQLPARPWPEPVHEMTKTGCPWPSSHAGPLPELARPPSPATARRVRLRFEHS